MKTKIIFILSAFLFIAAPLGVFAETDPSQDRTGQAELYAGYGTLSVIPVFVGIFGALGGALSGANDMEGHNTGVIQAGVNWYVANWFLMGVYGSYEGFGMSYDDNQELYNISLFTAQARATFQYGPKNVKFYHAINGGYMFLGGGEDGTQSSPIFGITPLGIKVKCTDNLSIFTEIGFVSNSFISGGLNYRIN